MRGLCAKAAFVGLAFASSQCLAQAGSSADQSRAIELPPVEVVTQTPKPKRKPKRSSRSTNVPAARTSAATVPVQPEELPEAAIPPNAPPSTGTIGQLPPSYAGGQVATGAQVGVLGNRSIFDVPLSIESYTAEGIQNRQATTITEVLDADPSVMALGRGNAFEYFNIRGFLSRQPYDARFDGLNIPHLQTSVTELYERVEVIKGPSALLYPQIGGIAGTINYIPKLARDVDITQLTTSLTSDSQFRGHLDVGRRYGNWGARANGVGNTGDTYRRDGEYDLAAGSLALDYRGDRVRFAIYGDFADSTLTNMQGFSADFTGIGELPVPNPRTVGSFNNGPFYDATSSRGYVTGEIDLTENVTAYAKFGASQTDSTNDSFNACPFDAAGNCLITPYRYDEDRYYLASEAGLRANFDTGFIGHRLTLAGSTLDDVYKDMGDGYQLFDSFNTNFFNPKDVYLRVPIYTATDYFGRTEVRSVALADTLSVLNEAIQLTLGVRRQEIKTSGEFDGAAEPSYADAATTPMYGLVVKPWRNLSLYASYIEALEKGGSADPGAANFPITLAPAISKQKEIGAKWNLGSVAVTLALFDIERPNDFLDSNNIFGRNGLQRNRGIELETFGEPIKGVRIIGGMTFLDPEIIDSVDGLFDGKAPTGAPEFVTKFGAEWDVPGVRGFTLTGLVIYSGEQFANEANTTFLADWTRFDLGFRYAMTDSIVVRGVVQNVANERYWESADRGFFLNIGAPRTYALATTFNF
jgi:iron complex outermembrane receptor protein